MHVGVSHLCITSQKASTSTQKTKPDLNYKIIHAHKHTFSILHLEQFFVAVFLLGSQ